MKYLIVFASLLLLPLNAFSQIKIEGDKNATVGYMLKLKLTQLDVTDPQIKCFPDNPDWIATKDFANQAWIIFVPGKKSIPVGQSSALYTFVIAGNKENKTYLETFEVIVRSDESEPAPSPNPSELFKDLKAAYLVSPDEEGKAQLIKVYEAFLQDIINDKFKSFKEAGDSLAEVAPKRLQKVKDVVANYFVKNVGQSGWNKDKLSTAVTEVITALKKL